MKTTVKWVATMLTGVALLANYGEGFAKTTISAPSVKVIKEQTKGKVANTRVSYRLANGYFVKNTVKGPLTNAKFDTQKGFEEVFGAAATMGRKGRPTPMDFNKKFVVAVVGEKTDLATKLVPLSLVKDANGDLVFSYRTVVGKKQSFTMVPNLVILVDKNHTGKVTVKEVK